MVNNKFGDEVIVSNISCNWVCMYYDDNTVYVTCDVSGVVYTTRISYSKLLNNTVNTFRNYNNQISLITSTSVGKDTGMGWLWVKPSITFSIATKHPLVSKLVYGFVLYQDTNISSKFGVYDMVDHCYISLADISGGDFDATYGVLVDTFE